MDSSSLVHFFSHYGVLVLYLWLLSGIFIVPVPEEVVMLTIGILISRGEFTFWALFVACLGSLSGVTVSYLLGRFLGRLLIVKYGKWVGLTQKRLAKGEALFSRYGKWSLPCSYFIPGTRHLVGIIAGTTQFEFKSFALFAYPAGVIWVSLLVIVGYFSGEYWLQLMHLIAQYSYGIILSLIALFLVALLIYWYISHKKRA